MIIKCPNCNGALEYDIEQGLLYCRFCGSFHTPKELDLPDANEEEEETSETGAMPEDEEIEVDPEILAATRELNEAFLGATSNPTERKIVKYDSMQGIAKGASDARKRGTTGNMLYDLPPEQREKNRNRMYKDQKVLHEAYRKRQEDGTDYTKAFAGTSYENLTWEEIDKRRKQEWEDERKKSVQLTEMSAGFSPEAIKKGEKVQRDNLDYYTKNYNASGTIPKKKKRVLYTASGARIIRDMGGVFLTTDIPLEEESVATIDNKIYTCTACGAELALTDTEISAFCSYCGQPTIVFDRMEKTTMPDSIIPFVITKEEALKKVRHRLDKGLLIPNKVKKFEVERLKGIYIPYWLFDADYEDSMVIKSVVKTGKTTVATRYYRVNGRCKLFYYPVDASKNLNDRASRKLEPYDYSGLRPFNIAYMSGFYSDRFDMSADTMMTIAMYRAQRQMCELASSQIPGEEHGIMEGAPMFHVKKKYYIMLPAWFMTFLYEGKPYTIMVNGQTGKVVGTVPFSKKKFYAVAAGLSALCCLVTVPLGILVTPFLTGSLGIMNVLIILLVILAVLFIIGLSNIREYKQNVELSAESQITDYVKERQDAES